MAKQSELVASSVNEVTERLDKTGTEIYDLKEQISLAQSIERRALLMKLVSHKIELPTAVGRLPT